MSGNAVPPPAEILSDTKQRFNYQQSRKGASNDSGVIENVDFHDFCTLRLRQLRKWGQQYYTVLFSPLSPFQWPQNMWPWMTLTGYLALNSVFAPVWLAETARLRKIIVWKLIKIDTYCQRCKSSAGTPVSGDIRFVRIFGRVLWKETLNDSEVGHALTLV